MSTRKLVEDLKQRAINVGTYGDSVSPKVRAEVCAALAQAEAALFAHIAQQAMPPIQDLANRFLGWKLPQTFGPDCFITFEREKAKANQSWPVGTNLLSADEARQMLEHVLGVRGLGQQTVPPQPPMGPDHG